MNQQDNNVQKHETTFLRKQNADLNWPGSIRKPEKAKQQWKVINYFRLKSKSNPTFQPFGDYQV